jgi:ornithine carbamoyltransferase
MKRDFISIADWNPEEIIGILSLSRQMKEYPANYHSSLEGKSVAMILEKPSLRTHVTFDIGINQLGAHCVYLNRDDVNLGKRESLYDVGKNLERWVDAAVVRTYDHKTCVTMAEAMRIPLINALTDHEHPCQAVGDFLTIFERLTTFQHKKLVFVGDGNNVCHSLMLMAAKVGMNFVAATPRGYLPKGEVFRMAAQAASDSGAVIDIVHNPREAVRGADVVYTDVWASMGQEDEIEERREEFRAFQVDASLMRRAKPDALFMHCLPAHRGEEVTDDVMNSPHSVVFDQAENRLHTEKAILHAILRLSRQEFEAPGKASMLQGSHHAALEEVIG